MKKTLIISALSLSMILILFTSTIHAQNLDIINHEITLTTKENEDIEVKENILLQSNIVEPVFMIDFWIQKQAKDVVILVNGTEYAYINDETRFSVNISILKIKIGDQLRVEIIYILDKDTQNFEKKFFQNTASFSMVYDNKMIFSSINIAKGAQLTIPIYKIVKTEQPLTIYYIIIIILLIIILLTFAFIFKLKKVAKVTKISSPTEEVLKTKKTLLMSLLKELEKQYRAKEISDDTYHKLKEQYKQETVETMKKLDDLMKSKV
ncbi:MAG: hypothetical protein ACQXXF_01755 [Thermoplasmatota archaeon]|jgi:uncharacterized membrane protein